MGWLMVLLIAAAADTPAVQPATDGGFEQFFSDYAKKRDGIQVLEPQRLIDRIKQVGAIWAGKPKQEAVPAPKPAPQAKAPAAPRHERQEPRPEHRQEARSEHRHEARPEPRQESRHEPDEHADRERHRAPIR